MPLVQLTKEESIYVFHALHYWANYIETGNRTTSAVDAKKHGKPYNALTEDQMREIIRLRELATKVVAP
jgi:hypothetical protein